MNIDDDDDGYGEEIFATGEWAMLGYHKGRPSAVIMYSPRFETLALERRHLLLRAWLELITKEMLKVVVAEELRCIGEGE
jgi:hypothetical protein